MFAWGVFAVVVRKLPKMKGVNYGEQIDSSYAQSWTKWSVKYEQSFWIEAAAKQKKFIELEIDLLGKRFWF